MLETTMLRWIEGTAGAARDGQRAGRRIFMAGRSGPDGGWARVAPDSEPARRFLPGPFSLTMLVRGRPAAGSSG